MSDTIGTIGGIAAALTAWKSRCKKRVQRGDYVMSPMDELLWFATPQVSTFTITSSPTRILQANPMRVGVFFSAWKLDVLTNWIFSAGTGHAATVPNNDTALSIVGTNNPGPGGVTLAETGKQSSSNSTFDFTSLLQQGSLQPLTIALNPTVTPIIDTSGGAAAGNGLFLTSFAPTLNITESQWGPLPSLPWTANSTTIFSAYLSVIELILLDWPKEG